MTGDRSDLGVVLDRLQRVVQANPRSRHYTGRMLTLGDAAQLIEEAYEAALKVREEKP